MLLIGLYLDAHWSLSAYSTFTSKCLAFKLSYSFNRRGFCAGGNGEIRSKTRVIPGYHHPNDINFFPEWNYDGSSTDQADSNGNTEVILKPCAYFKDPLTTTKNAGAYIGLCNTYIEENIPHPTNFRHNAAKLFELGEEEEPWFGLEQEYFMRGIITKKTLRDEKTGGENFDPHWDSYIS